MPTWSGILDELRKVQQAGEGNAFDKVRRKYLDLLHRHTRRNVLLYATAFTQSKFSPPGTLQVSEEDIQGLMEVVHGLPADPTDIIIHSPGGSAEVAEGIVEYLHTQYPHIRAIIPQAAMSAATMIASGTDEIVMGKHSHLGPIDPQLYIPTSKSFEPAGAIIEQFELAIENAPKPGMEAWAAMLQMYGPSLIVQCRDLINLAERLVTTWLTKWMLKDSPDGPTEAARIAGFLANRKNFLTHGRQLRRDHEGIQALKILKLEEDQVFQDLVLSVFHATTHTFDGTNAVKIIENHKGKAFIKMVALERIQSPVPAPRQKQKKRPKKRKR